MMAAPFLDGEWNRAIWAKQKFSANSTRRIPKPKRRSRIGTTRKVRGLSRNATSHCWRDRMRKSDEDYRITMYGGTKFSKHLTRMAYHWAQAHSFSSHEQLWLTIIPAVAKIQNETNQREYRVACVPVRQISAGDLQRVISAMVAEGYEPKTVRNFWATACCAGAGSGVCYRRIRESTKNPA